MTAASTSHAESRHADVRDFVFSHAAVVFDVDDTLVLTLDTAFCRTADALAAMGDRSLAKSEFNAVYGFIPFPSCVRVLRPAVNLDLFLAEYTKASSTPYRLACDIVLLFEELLSRGHQIGIVTNTPRARLIRKLGAASLALIPERYLWCGDDHEHLKPDPRAFDGLKREMAFSSARLLYVGDSVCDERASTAAGLGFLPVRTGLCQWGGRRSHVLDSVSDLLIMLSSR